MKELSIEEKAKRYDEALKVAKGLYAKDAPDSLHLERMFTELKESDGEKIRKALIKLVKKAGEGYENVIDGVSIENAISWLEKQGEQKPFDYEKAHIQQNDFAPKSALEAIKGEKVDNANKVEPKFKMEKGKWYVCDTSRYTDFIVGKAYYCPENGMLKPNENEIARYVARDCFHLWTIQDAKDGDVLYECNEKKPFIFKELKTKHIDDIASYCDIFNGIFTPNEDSWTTLDIVPATKEQRDLLFKKMKEAGYEWNAERKELKKIEQPTAWSEEDEAKLKSILFHIEDVENKDVINWLKSLKERNTWKPSEKQMEALEHAINCYSSISPTNTEEVYTLEIMKEKLKKLREK